MIEGRSHYRKPKDDSCSNCEWEGHSSIVSLKDRAELVFLCDLAYDASQVCQCETSFVQATPLSSWLFATIPFILARRLMLQTLHERTLLPTRRCDTGEVRHSRTTSLLLRNESTSVCSLRSSRTYVSCLLLSFLWLSHCWLIYSSFGITENIKRKGLFVTSKFITVYYEGWAIINGSNEWLQKQQDCDHSKWPLFRKKSHFRILVGRDNSISIYSFQRHNMNIIVRFYRDQDLTPCSHR